MKMTAGKWCKNEWKQSPGANDKLLCSLRSWHPFHRQSSRDTAQPSSTFEVDKCPQILEYLTCLRFEPGAAFCWSLVMNPLHADKIWNQCDFSRWNSLELWHKNPLKFLCRQTSDWKWKLSWIEQKLACQDHGNPGKSEKWGEDASPHLGRGRKVEEVFLVINCS